jgi:uncharacterized protein (TIGR00369 family)
MENKGLSVADLQALVAPSHFHQLFAPQIISVDNQRLELVLAVTMSECLERQPGTRQWHGGAISAVIDISGCYALCLGADGAPPPTINFQTDYLRPAIDTDLTAHAHVRRAGRTAGVVDVDVVDSIERLVAVGRGCYSMRGGFSSR